MNKKSILVILFSGILLFGCGNSEIDDNREQTEVKETGEQAADTLVSESYGDEYASWNDAYFHYINESLADYPGFQYSLIYLDDDDQPELFIQCDAEAAGEIVASFHNNKLNILHLSRIGSIYIPHSGLIYNDCGHMDWYPVNIYKLTDGDFYRIGEGIWGGLDWEGGVELNENGELDYQYEWEGKRCSEEEFHTIINNIFQVDHGVRPEDWYTLNEILSLLKT